MPKSPAAQASAATAAVWTIYASSRRQSRKVRSFAGQPDRVSVGDTREALVSLKKRAADMRTDTLADALLDLALDLRTERAAALVLVDLHDVGDLRQQLRTTMRSGVAEILVRAGKVPQARSADAARAVITVIKSAGTLATQPGTEGAINELRRLVRCYLEQ